MEQKEELMGAFEEHGYEVFIQNPLPVELNTSLVEKAKSLGITTATAMQQAVKKWLEA